MNPRSQLTSFQVDTIPGKHLAKYYDDKRCGLTNMHIPHLFLDQRHTQHQAKSVF